ncbi:MAG: transglutaminase domain-containing protein [Spirochaetaceae bacterium]|jgi:hypothetical protein|nr:transglutaminase domain-containing protein [Spirochaetaceae bacterium]
MKKSAFAAILLFYAGFQAQTADFTENFDSGKLNEKLWSGDFKITDSAAETAGKNDPFFGNGTSFVKLSAGLQTTNILKLSPLVIEEPSVLTFRYKTEIDSRANQQFTVSVNGENPVSYTGSNAGWRTGRLSLKSGEHTVIFQTSAKNMQITGGYNAVYLDDIMLIPDKPVKLSMFPAAAVDSFVGAEGAAQIHFSPSMLRSDGSVRPNKEAVTWTVYKDKIENGEVSATIAKVNPDGFFSAAQTGVYIVSAKSAGFTALSGEITIHPANYLLEPYTYPGTGKTYSGFIKAQSASPPAPSSASIHITQPPARDFETDAFFTLEGKITKPKARNYGRVEIIKKSEKGQKTPPLKTWYIINDSFSCRIWLPFGEGEYTVTVQIFDSVTLTNPQKGEGALRGGSYTEEPLEFNVINTRQENGLDGDGRWIYPSYFIQSDSFVVTNLMREITANLKTDLEKITAIHDYVVSELVYDQQSLRNPGRARKTDAVSVIENKTALCEGYSYLSAALMRSAGINVRIVTSRSINHAWNNVYNNGKWLFYDATWDDPVPDRGPEIIGRTYFLLESLTGGGSRHGNQGKIMIGDVE